MAMKLRDKPITISSAKLGALPVVKCNSSLVEAVVSATNDDGAWQEENFRAMERNSSPDISSEDETLSYKGRLWIPVNLQLNNQILEVQHNRKVTGHMGQDQTIELVRRNNFALEMEIIIEEYVCSCPVCQRNKAAHHIRYAFLQPLEFGYRMWDSISMDFIIELPVSD